MVKLIFVLFFLHTTSLLMGQIRAVTDTGDEVLLNEDGTWKYLNDSLTIEKLITENTNEFKKSDSSTFLLKSTRINLGFWLNPGLWSFKKSVDNSDAEFQLQLKSEDLYGLIISEQIEIPLLTLRNLAIENGQAAAPDLEVDHEEYRSVNGLRVLHLQMSGTIQGIEFTYYGYYYSNEKGTVQFLTYTAKSLLEKYRSFSEDLLNGMVLLVDNE